MHSRYIITLRLPEVERLSLRWSLQEVVQHQSYCIYCNFKLLKHSLDLYLIYIYWTVKYVTLGGLVTNRATTIYEWRARNGELPL